MTVKIGWVNDFEVGLHKGGSSYTQERALEFAPDTYNIVICPPWELRTDCDIYIINNHVTYDEEQLAFLAQAPRVYWSHDSTPALWQVREGYLSRIVNGCRRTIFLSPLHAQMFLINFGAQVANKRVKLSPAMVDPAPFEALDLKPISERERSAFWIGTFERSRGPRKAMEWAEDNEVHLDFYGYGRMPDFLDNSEYAHKKGEVKRGDVPALMASYQRYVYLPLELEGRRDKVPLWVDACGRAAIEARLAGCEIVTNKALGVTSWDWFSNRRALIKAMKLAPIQFWKIIDSAVERK